jgi:hypothetical protein
MAMSADMKPKSFENIELPALFFVIFLAIANGVAGITKILGVSGRDCVQNPHPHFRSRFY